MAVRPVSGRAGSRALGLYREPAAWLFGERLGVGLRPDPEQLASAVIADPSSLAASFIVTRTGPGIEALPPMADLPLKPTGVHEVRSSGTVEPGTPRWPLPGR